MNLTIMKNKTQVTTNKNSIPAKLNLGCGIDTKKEYYNVDVVKTPGCDKIIDFNKPNCDLPSDYFEEIYVHMVVEQLENIHLFVREVWRIGKDHCKIKIPTPYYNCRTAHQPINKLYFNLDAFRHWTEQGKWRSYYPDLRNEDKPLFNLLSRKTIPTPFGKIIPALIRDKISKFIPELNNYIVFELEILK